MLAGFLDPPIWRPENSVDMWNFGYPGDWLSELNQQTFAQVLFLTLMFFRQTRSRRSFVSRIAITPKFKMRRFSNQVRPPTGLKWCKCRSLYAWWMFPPAWLISFDVTWKRSTVLQAEYTCQLFFLAVLSQITAHNLLINLKLNALLNEPENQAI